MAAPRVLPGFYWDPEKGKYFKLEKNAVPGTAQAKYTQSNVSQVQKRTFDELREKRKSERLERETVVRPHTRRGWGAELAILSRESGARQNSYYMRGVWPDACVSGMGKMKKVVEQPSHGIIRFFDCDPRTKTIYAVHGDNAIRRRKRNPPDRMSLLDDMEEDTMAVSLPNGEFFRSSVSEPRNDYSFEPWDMLARLTSSISSLIYLPTSGALAATTLGSDRSPVVYLADPDVDGPYVNQQFTPSNCVTIFGAAAPPFTGTPNSIPQAGTESLAVAASRSLRLFTRSPAGDWNSSVAVETDVDVMSLDWTSPTTVAFGKRNGKICIYDTRSGGVSTLLTHPFPVVKLKRADDPTRLLCAGVQDSLFLYDTRSRSTFSKHEPGHYNDRFFVERYTGPRNQKKRKLLKHGATGDWSQPILSFRYSNPDDIYLDVAVQPDMGLIAAAQDVGSSTVLRLYNMWTGKVVKEFPQETPTKIHIRCLKFMQDDNGDPELWSTWGGAVVKTSLVK